jgi:hypothetical protein
MSQQPRTTRIPAPLYAAAGAGELAYEQLRKLPAVVTDLSGKASISGSELREKAVATTTQLRGRAVATLRNANSTAAALRGKANGGELDVDRLRAAALRNAAVVVANAQAAQERAAAAYGALVARGERIVGTGVVQAADTVNADMEATEAPAEVTATPAPETPAVDGPKAVTEAPGAAKPATRARRSGTAAPGAKPAAKSTGPARGERPTGRE